MSIRAGVLLLYAHWEGWIKNISRLYIRYVNGMRLSYRDLSAPFLGNALKTHIHSLESGYRAARHNEFALLVQTKLDSRASLDETLIDAQSNLSSKVLADIVARLGIFESGDLTSRFHLIDESLVARRNTIAHGEYLDITLSEFKELQTQVVQLLDAFTDEISNSAAQRKFLQEVVTAKDSS